MQFVVFAHVPIKYVCVSVCMHAWTCMHYMPGHTCVLAHVCMHVCMYACVRTYKRARMRACVCSSIHVCTCLCYLLAFFLGTPLSLFPLAPAFVFVASWDGIAFSNSFCFSLIFCKRCIASTRLVFATSNILNS